MPLSSGVSAVGKLEAKSQVSAVAKEVLARRHLRSFLPPEDPTVDLYVDHFSGINFDDFWEQDGPRPPNPAELLRLCQLDRLYLTTAEFTNGNLEENEYELLVMMQNGIKRPARDMYEWVQQYCVEQCALYIALDDLVPQQVQTMVNTYMDIPCQLPEADGYSAPQLCMSCGNWWNLWSTGSLDVEDCFHALVRERRHLEMTARAARIVLSKRRSEGHLLYSLIEPFLLEPMAETFPCTRANLGDFLEKISVGEHGGNYKTFTSRFGTGADRLGGAVNDIGTVLDLEPKTHEIDLEVFTEFDMEGGCLGAYCISNRPLYDPKFGLMGDPGEYPDTYPVRHHGYDRGNEEEEEEDDDDDEEEEEEKDYDNED